MSATNLVLIAARKHANQAIAAWERVMPEDDLILMHIAEQPWKDDLVFTIHSDRPEYIQALQEIIGEEIPADQPRLVSVF